ncbi:hypothetical protein EGW08_012343 [Elysia chlorotica]|uniref:Homeobox domain-containing protein n=1 Tax=Elysia chlorotica TaxID=188477 RepID=A0A433TEB4_ELYCH|nr:hypothetical protein EGW08_012343 [Elysia chlorotica]
MSLQDMRLLAAAYPGAFAAVSSMAAVGFHPHNNPNHPLHPLHRHQHQLPGYPLPFPGFPYPAPTAEQMAALDCSVRNQRASLHIHHQRLLQEETSARLQAAASSATSSSAMASSSSSPTTTASSALPSSSSSSAAASSSSVVPASASSPASSSSAPSSIISASRPVFSSEMLLDSLLGQDHRKTPQHHLQAGLHHLRASPVSAGLNAPGAGLDVGPFTFLDSPEHHVKMADVLNSSGKSLPSESVWFQNRRAKWRKKENTKKGPGRPAHNAHPQTCSGEPMDEEEIRRRDIERQEKKRRKQEERLRKMEEKRRCGMHCSVDGGSTGGGDMMRIMMEDDARSASSKSLRLSMDNFLSPTSSLSGTEASCSSFSDHISAMSEKGCASGDERIIFGGLSGKSALSPGSGNALSRPSILSNQEKHHDLHHLDSSVLPTPPRAHENPSNTNNAKSSPFSIDRLLESPKVPRGRRPNSKYPMIQACKSLGASLSLGLLPFFPITQPMGFLVPQVMAGPDSPLSAASFGKSFTKAAVSVHGERFHASLAELSESSRKPEHFLNESSRKPEHFLNPDVRSSAFPADKNIFQRSTSSPSQQSPTPDWSVRDRSPQNNVNSDSIADVYNGKEEEPEPKSPLTTTSTTRFPSQTNRKDDLVENGKAIDDSAIENSTEDDIDDMEVGQDQSDIKNNALNLSVFSDRNNNKGDLNHSKETNHSDTPEDNKNLSPSGNHCGETTHFKIPEVKANFLFPETDHENESDSENIDVDEVDVEGEETNN